MTLLVNGGWVLWILLLLSTTSLALVLQKIWFLNATRINPRFIDSIKQQLKVSDQSGVIKALRSKSAIEYRLAAIAIANYQSNDGVIAAEINDVTKVDLQVIQSKMGFLAMVTTVAPVLGLLGTVIGLMDVFSVLAVEGVGNAQLLSSGISKALITTVAGLSLAIPLMFIHQYLSNRIERRIDDWDRIPTQIISSLRG